LSDYSPLLNPRAEPQPWLMNIVDISSWALPAVSALLAVLGGCAALGNSDQWAAILSIAAGVIGALGVLATNWSSRIRDHRIEQAKSLAGLSIDIVETVQRNLPIG